MPMHNNVICPDEFVGFAFIQNGKNQVSFRLDYSTLFVYAEDFALDSQLITDNLKFLRRNADPLKLTLRTQLLETLVKCGVKVLQVPAFMTAPYPLPCLVTPQGIIVGRLQREKKILAKTNLNAFKIAV